MSREQALHYLRDHQVMTLATTGPDGVWAAAVFYVNHEFDLYFLSAQQTRHATQIAQQPRVAATIQEDYTDWEQIKGIQLAGLVRLLADHERDRVITLYKQKYPFVAQPTSEIGSALEKISWYCLTPDQLFFIDNSKGLGHREQIF